MKKERLLKPDSYNPKAREAFAKSLIDIGVSIFKGIMLLFTVVPLAAVLKSALDENDSATSIFSIINSLTIATQALILGLIVIGFVAAHFFRKEGLRHLHEIESSNEGQVLPRAPSSK